MILFYNQKHSFLGLVHVDGGLGQDATDHVNVLHHRDVDNISVEFSFLIL